MTFTTPRRHAVLVLALAVLGGAALTGCGPDGPDGAALSGSQGPVPRALGTFYGQKPTWNACGDLECATLTVPMDYAHPEDGRTFVLPLARARAKDPGARIGSLLVNPGGPGGSGVAMLEGGAVDSFGARVRARFDIVGFDPRGVGGSTPAVDCTGDDAAPGTGDKPDGTDGAGRPDGAGGEATGGLYPRTDEERKAALADADRTAQACKARSGAILPHVGTPDAARDMDVLRAVLGDEKLSFLGFSYGTSLGTSYAELFPRRVRALVLDGAIDPAKDWYQRSVEQSAAFRSAVDDYAQHCAEVAKEACPAATPDGIRRLVDDLYEKAAKQPLPVPGTADHVDLRTLHTVITMSMYTPEDQWADLSEALKAAQGGDGTKLAELAGGDQAGPDDQSGQGSRTAGTHGRKASTRGPRPADAERDNSDDAFTAVNCLEVSHPRDPQAYWEAVDRSYRDAGVYGPSGVVDELVCHDWPAAPREPHSVDAKDAPPVLVVGTTGDPATPYADAQGLARQFPAGMLLTYRGFGHTAYGRSNACVGDAVDAYLTELRPIPTGTTC
ncbi:alpha/beta hydrolase [Kitasatospora sp. NPDC001309]|uniref:alpha/beta hydrolase n=1 Tax=Kitasatospora sp. NPDC001309 TaxID=3364013 RepID=UPI003697C3BA